MDNEVLDKAIQTMQTRALNSVGTAIAVIAAVLWVVLPLCLGIYAIISIIF